MAGYFAGVDIGSTMTKVVIICEGIVSSVIGPTGPEHRRLAYRVMTEALDSSNLSFEELSYVVATGYGRINVPFADKQITEISCHARGIHSLLPTARTIIDMGGQDTKGIRLKDGKVANFVMNDKCAAGTGRSLELMSKYLGVHFSELAALAEKAGQTITITSQCSIFSELEIMHYLMEDKNPADIAAGINEAMARRVKMLVGRVGIKPGITITGGVCKNSGVVKNLETMLDIRFTPLTEDPQIVGALGAAMFAAERFKRHQKKLERSDTP